MPLSASRRPRPLAAALAAALALAAGGCDAARLASTEPSLGVGVEAPGRRSPPALRAWVVAGDSQRAEVGSRLPAPVVVRVIDTAKRPLAGHWVHFRALNGGDSLSADSARTDAAGEARVEWTLGRSAGPRLMVVQTRARRTRALADTVSAHGEPGPPVRLNFGASDIRDGQAFLFATVRDRFSNYVEGLTVTWTVVEGGGRIDPPSALASPLATAMWTLGPSGVQTFRISAGELSGTHSVTLPSQDGFRIAGLAGWSPTSYGPSPRGVILVDPETGDWSWKSEPATGSYSSYHELAWSPDGDSYVFVKDEYFDLSYLFSEVVGVGPVSSFPLGCSCLIDDLAWSPDGALLAATVGGEVKVGGNDGSIPARVLGAGARPQWSPDGARVFFVSANEVRSAGRDGTDLTTHVRGVSEATRGWLSPEGGRLAYTPQGEAEVYVSALDGSGAVRVTEGCGCVSQGWSRDGRTILAVGGGGAGPWLRVAADGSGTTPVAVPAGSRFQDFSPDGSLLFLHGSNEILVAYADGRVVPVPSPPFRPNFVDEARWLPAP
ncbi:MAG TPA: hypothetical protein VHG91_06440 [Longimicrobium sp.]|nr:hypothetical protein [Longimicrobium sp.]